MKNIVSEEKEQTLDILPEYKENPAMESLWKKAFKDEYKPNEKIDFQQIKDFIVNKKKENEYWKVNNYTYEIIDPEKLCDIFISNPNKSLSISLLESLPGRIKKCIADMFLELVSLENIKKKLGTAMIFRIRRYTYKYSRKYEKDLKEFFINSTDFVGSERNFRLLQKAYMAVRDHTIDTTLLLFEILKQAPEDIKSPDIQTYLQQKLGNDFSLGALYSQDNVLDGKGREEEWCGKNIDSKGNSILQDTINRTTIRDEYIVNDKEKRISVIDRENPDIYKDRSGTQYKIYLDAPIGIGLFHNNKPIALISFSLQDSTTLFIRQLQNVTVEHFDRYGRIIEKKTDITAQTIPRQETLYDIVNLLAKKYQCKKIVIQSGENNPWLDIKRLELQYNEDEERLEEVEIDQPHLSLDIAKKIYNVFAKKQKFRRNKETKNRDKEI